jgi:sec-independent protein translocase protein TatA
MPSFRDRAANTVSGVPTLDKQGARMFEGLFQAMHLLVILVVSLLVFAPKKLPDFGKGLGEGIRDFKTALAQTDDGRDNES